jgi:hypothetical protein
MLKIDWARSLEDMWANVSQFSSSQIHSHWLGGWSWLRYRVVRPPGYTSWGAGTTNPVPESTKSGSMNLTTEFLLMYPRTPVLTTVVKSVPRNNRKLPTKQSWWRWYRMSACHPYTHNIYWSPNELLFSPAKPRRSPVRDVYLFFTNCRILTNVIIPIAGTGLDGREGGLGFCCPASQPVQRQALYIFPTTIIILKI